MSMLSKIIIAAGLGLATLPAASISSSAADWRLDAQEDAVEVGAWDGRGGPDGTEWRDEAAFDQVQYGGWDRGRGWDRGGGWDRRGRGRCEVVTRIIRTPYGTRRIQEERCGGRPGWDRPGWDRRGGWDRHGAGGPGWGGGNPGNWGRTDGHTLSTEERAYLR